ncbi:unnamed protein product [Closterium sp. NIES-65]|nr:unnamed protein product [Closterium sp. NIES-65]
MEGSFESYKEKVLLGDVAWDTYVTAKLITGTDFQLLRRYDHRSKETSQNSETLRPPLQGGPGRAARRGKRLSNCLSAPRASLSPSSVLAFMRDKKRARLFHDPSITDDVYAPFISTCPSNHNNVLPCISPPPLKSPPLQRPFPPRACPPTSSRPHSSSAPAAAAGAETPASPPAGDIDYVLEPFIAFLCHQLTRPVRAVPSAVTALATTLRGVFAFKAPQLSTFTHFRLSPPSLPPPADSPDAPADSPGAPGAGGASSHNSAGANAQGHLTRPVHLVRAMPAAITALATMLRDVSARSIFAKADGLTRPVHPVRAMPAAITALATTLRDVSARSIFAKADGVRLLLPYIAPVAGQNQMQLLYEAVLCLWLLSFHEPSLEAIRQARILPRLIDVAKSSAKEKCGWRGGADVEQPHHLRAPGGIDGGAGAARPSHSNSLLCASPNQPPSHPHMSQIVRVAVLTLSNLMTRGHLGASMIVRVAVLTLSNLMTRGHLGASMVELGLPKVVQSLTPLHLSQPPNLPPTRATDSASGSAHSQQPDDPRAPGGIHGGAGAAQGRAEPQTARVARRACSSFLVPCTLVPSMHASPPIIVRPLSDHNTPICPIHASRCPYQDLNEALEALDVGLRHNLRVMSSFAKYYRQARRCSEARSQASYHTVFPSFPLCSLRVSHCHHHQDLKEALEALDVGLRHNLRVMSSFDKYRQEVLSGSLDWTPMHKDAAFWRENVMHFEDNDFQGVGHEPRAVHAGSGGMPCHDLGQFISCLMRLRRLIRPTPLHLPSFPTPHQVLRALVALLDTSHEAKTLAVACHDLGQFITYHPAGRGVAHDMKGKERVLRLLDHADPDVRKQALLAVQKLLLSAKYVSYLQ